MRRAARAGLCLGRCPQGGAQVEVAIGERAGGDRAHEGREKSEYEVDVHCVLLVLESTGQHAIESKSIVLWTVVTGQCQ